MPIPSPTTPPTAPSSADGVPTQETFPASSVVTVEQNFGTYNLRPRATPAEIECTNITASTTLEFTPIIVRVNATSGAVTVTLPLASSAFGRKVWIVKTDAGVNAVTIAVQTGDTLWRPATITTITVQHGCQSYLATSDGTNMGWQYVGGG